MSQPSRKLYSTDASQDDTISPSYGDEQVLIAGEKDVTRKLSNEGRGTLKKEYYD